MIGDFTLLYGNDCKMNKAVALAQILFDDGKYANSDDDRTCEEKGIGYYQIRIENGFDAIENKKNGFVEILTYEKEEFIIIEVKDNGCGISEENKSKIFNPFFTTKPTGTGLGLSLVYKIIMAIGGEMEFKSKKGAGTSFYIKFNKNKLSSKLLLTKQQ